jgi:hypothetical protein
MSKHRQSWFTYSYCHGRDGEIRQFRELIQARPLSTQTGEPHTCESIAWITNSVQAPIARKKILMQVDTFISLYNKTNILTFA